MTWHVRRVPTVTVVVAFTFIGVVLAGNTTCSGKHLDWYTDVVGETPCMTYQRLRQICDSHYQVPNFRPNTPGDNCNDQLAQCCCNSISWSLSMLCMNCQAFQEPNGIDAGAGAYNLYRMSGGKFCSPGTNKTLPDDIQRAVCNANIRLDNFLYDIFWNTGDWFYEYTRQSATEKHIENNNNTFTHCPNQIVSSATPTSRSSSSHSLTSPTSSGSHPPASSGKSNAQAVATGVGIGVGLVLLGLLFAVLWLYYRKRKPRRVKVDLDSEPTKMVDRWTPAPGHPATYVTPFVTSNDDLLSGIDVGQSLSGTDLSKQDRSESKVTLSGSGPPSTSPPTSGVVIRPPSQDNALPERHEDAGAIIVLLERSASGRLPPEYMSWNSGERPNMQVAPEVPVRSPDMPSK